MTAFVLLHGFAQTPASWDEVVRQLQAAGHRTYVPDLYKRSDYSLEQLCAYIAEVVRKVAQADGVPVLAGYSMGGRIAAETLVRHRDLPLAGLVLESAGLGPADEKTRKTLAERNASWAARLREEGVAAFMDWWETLPLFATQRSLSLETRAAIRAERTARDAEPLARSLEAWGAHCQSAEEDTVAALVDLANRAIPVLYLAGALDEKYAAVAARVRAAASCDCSQISCDREAGLYAELVPSAGHNVHLERAAAFVGAASRLLDHAS